MRVRPFATASAIALSSLLPAHAVTLYDPGLNLLPTAQGWSVVASGAAVSQALVGGQYQLDTRSPDDARFGHWRFSPISLNTATGFVLDFSLQVMAESHTNLNRAGYSLVLIGADASKSLELSFWTGNVWVQDYVPGTAGNPGEFVHGSDLLWNSQSAMNDYRLSVSNHEFVLSSGGQNLIDGALRDYSAHGLPYNLPNFIFFGDNSNSGQSHSALGLVSLSPVPEPAPQLLLLAGLAGLAWRCRRAAPKA